MVRSLMLLVGLGLLTACTSFREVRPGVFRSGQPTEDWLARRIEQYGMQSVICLRGSNDNSAPTARAAVGAGIVFASVPMSATSPPRPATLLELWRLAANAPRPVLLHCRAGVDRTGLAAALFVLHDTGDLALARAQLALLPHGHLALFGQQAMDAVLDRYEPHHGKLSFPDWVQQVYAAEFAARR